MCKTDPSPLPPPSLRTAAGDQGSHCRWEEVQGWGRACAICCPNYYIRTGRLHSHFDRIWSKQPLPISLFPPSERQDFYFCYENYLLSLGCRKQSYGWQRLCMSPKTVAFWCLNPHLDNIFQGQSTQPQTLPGSSRLPEAACLSL